MSELARGAAKMRIDLQDPAQYQMRLGEEELPLNELLGQSLQLEFWAKSLRALPAQNQQEFCPGLLLALLQGAGAV